MKSQGTVQRRLQQETRETQIGAADSPRRPRPEPDDPGRPPFPSWSEWRTFAWQALLVVGIELSDDTIRGLIVPRPPGPAQANAIRVMNFEQAHGLWVEPGIQHYFEQAHHWLGLTIYWSQVMTVVNSIYGISHSLVTLLVAAWIFWRRRAFYPFIRNVFIFATALSVIVYNLFPLAPPRLAVGLRSDGQPFRFVDTVFDNGGVNLSFDQYAAMPSLHVAWALIAGVALLVLARPLIVRIFGLLHPIIMTTAVIVTANHYIVDCLGGLGVDLIGLALACLLLVCQRWRGSPSPAQHRTHQNTAVPI